MTTLRRKFGTRALVWSAAAAVLTWLSPTAIVDGWPGETTPPLVRAAHAAETPSGEAVRRDIERYLAEIMHPAMSWSGDVSVRERDGAFDIVIPGVAFVDRKGGALDVGDIVATAHPEEDGRYRVVASMPGTMGHRDESGEVDVFIAIGTQRFEAVWAPEYGIFEQFDAAVGEIWVNEPGLPPAATIGALAVKGAAVETSPGLWNSPSVIRINDIRFNDETGAGTVTIGGFEMRSFVDGMKLEAQQNFARRIADELNREPDGGDAANADPLALLRAFDALPGLFGDLSTEVTLNDIAYQDAEGVRTFELGRAHHRFTMNDLNKDLAHVDLRYEHSGLDIAAGNGVPVELVPSGVKLDLSASRLPNELLWQAWLDWIKASTTSTPEFAQSLLSDRLSAAVLGAGSELEIERFAVEAPNFSFESNGVFRADGNALYNLTGDFDATIQGMDRLVAAMSAAAGEDREANNTAAILALIQALGVIETDENGGAVRRYRIEVPADGALVLNGSDISTILGVMDKQNQ